MLELHQVSKSFGRVKALRDVSLTAAPGRLTAILGPNGAGKTTAIRIATGSLKPDSGRAILAETDVLADPVAAQRALGYLPETAAPYPETTPRAYLHFRGRLWSMPRRDRKKAIERELDRCGLSRVAKRRIGNMSKGERRRVGLAAALLHDPPVLILDEPTDGLDPAQVRDTRALIASLAEERTVLLCTHILDEVRRLAAQTAVIVSGRILASGPPDTLAAAAGLRPTIAIQTQPPVDDTLVQALVQLPEIESAVRTDAGIRVTPTHIAHAPAEAIARYAMAHDILLTRISEEQPTLEEVFIGLLRRADQHQSQPEARA